MGSPTPSPVLHAGVHFHSARRGGPGQCRPPAGTGRPHALLGQHGGLRGVRADGLSAMAAPSPLGHSRSDHRLPRLGHAALDLWWHRPEPAEHVRRALGLDPASRPCHGALLPQLLHGDRHRRVDGKPDGRRGGRAEQRGDGPPSSLRVDCGGRGRRGDGAPPSHQSRGEGAGLGRARSPGPAHA